ncbi:hypothetical protein [Saccharothrix obliqua]|uniref:hypothetical protein n=1 Tax=Saccharothrix obliqua TaxID=2861747 RepID=UPI001C5FED34|nr:hypothetical protein [Saccharothrix obliqua]MBW4717401.1 hypothetical protein [Saccharothrix obliqua]
MALATVLPATTTVPAAAAESSACQRQPRDAVAQMCADQSQYMYGVFATFAYPGVTFGGAASWPVDFYNETEFFTDDLMTKSFAFGLDVRRQGTATTYQPYWIDYTNFSGYRSIGTAAGGSDLKVHTFMAIPSCSGCTTWDIFYDYVHVGTTGGQPSPSSHHLMTGWLLTGMYGPSSFPQTRNRVMFLDGNYQFVRFDRAATSVRAPAGDCSIGAHPDYCWRFDTAVSTASGGTAQYVTSWDVTKPMVQPGTFATTAPEAGQRAAQDADDETDQLVERAQQIVDQRLKIRR